MTIRVVVADDDPGVRLALRRAIAAQPDMAVSGEAGDGEEALRVVAETRPDALVLDVHMPGLSGFDVVRRIRARGDETPVVFLTGDSDAALLAGAVRGARALDKGRASVRDAVSAVRDLQLTTDPPAPRRCPGPPPA